MASNPSNQIAPVVAIIGRPNVGKSILLNAVAGKRISIVEDQPGVTRDRISFPLPIDVDGKTRYVEIVDTGGYGFVDPDKLTDHIQHQIEIAMSRASLVLFIVDCGDGLTSVDREIATLLRKREIKTVLIANKADSEKADAGLGDFARLGLGTPLGVSARTKRNLETITDAIAANLDLSNAPDKMPRPEMLLAIVGKRNSGKSTLVNAIAEIYEGDSDRVIVSEVPGTTRDSIDVRFVKGGKSLVVIDTAGVRKKKHMMTHDLEFYSFHRAQLSIRRADVVAMLIDGVEPISEPDKKLAKYIVDEHKPAILVINKWDLVQKEMPEKRDDEMMEEYRTYVDSQLPFMDFAPLVFVTATELRKVQSVLDVAGHLFNQSNIRLTTGRLNQVVKQIMAERGPSTPSGRRARIYYATQVATGPPTIVLFVNHPEFLTTPYRRFMVNRFRELLPYAEIPIKLVVRGRSQPGEERGQVRNKERERGEEEI